MPNFHINHINHLKFVAPLSFVVLFLSGIYFFHPWTESSVDALSETTDVEVNNTTYSIGISTSGDSINISADSTPSGTYSATKDTVTVDTNIPSGYSLYLSSSDTDTNLYLDGDTTKSYISSTNGTYSSPQVLRQNTYGYAIPNSTPDVVDNRFDDSYATPHPSAASKWAALPAAQQLIQTTSTSQSIDIYYGVFLNNAVAAGEYKGAVTYTALADATSATIQPQSDAMLNPTTGTAGEQVALTIVTNLHTMADVDTTTVSFSNNSNLYTCNNPTADTSTGVLIITCSTPTDLIAGTYTVTISIPSYGKAYTITNGYEATPNTLKDYLYLQDVTSSMCENTKTWEQENKTYTLIDSRDGNSYQVRKLKDNNCWLVQNLRLDLTAGKTLTSSDTDVTQFTPQNSTQTTDTFVSWGGTPPNASQIDQARSYKVGSGLPDDTQTSNLNYGNYYNWYAATAGTGTYALADRIEASGSICPKGWRVPPDEGEKSYANMLSSYGVVTTYNTSINPSTNEAIYSNKPLSIVYSGTYHYTERRVDGQGSGTIFSTSTSLGSGNKRQVVLNSDMTNLHSGASSAYGHSIRCVLR